MYTPKVITNRDEHRLALDAMRACRDDSTGEPKPGMEDRFELLATLIDTFERKEFPTPVVTSAFVLECTMDAKGWNQAQLSKALGSSSLVSDILRGKRDLTPAVITKLAREGMPITLLTSFVPLKHQKLLAKFSAPKSPVRKARPGAAKKAKA